MSSLKFNPLFCESYKNFSLCKDSENGSCEYDSEDSFNNMLAVNQIRLNLKCSSLETGLSLHMNIRRISNKFDKLTNFLGELRVKIPIIGISAETW